MYTIYQDSEKGIRELCSINSNWRVQTPYQQAFLISEIHTETCKTFMIELSREKWQGPKIESAKLRALRALVPHVPHSLRSLRPYVPCALRALVSHLPSTLRVSCPTCFRALRVSCLTCSRVLRASNPTCSCAPRVSCNMCCCVSPASCFTCLVSCVDSCLALYETFFLRTLLFRNLHTLCPNITFCVLEFPCITLLFFCWFAACDFFEEIYRTVKTNLLFIRTKHAFLS